MVEIIKKIVTNVLAVLYQYLGFCLILAVLFMFLYMLAKKDGWKNVFKQWWNEFKTNIHFRKIFILTFYISLVLSRTLLNRNIWSNPLSNVIGIWGLHSNKGDISTEAVENFILFVPFMIILLWTFKEKIVGENMNFKITLWQSLKLSFMFSLSIELFQLFFRIGTFQLSDLFHNTIGGIAGGIIFLIVYKVKHRNHDF